jgi:RNA exonuclease NGL2
MVGDSLLAAQEESLDRSRVVHVSIDPSVPPNVMKEPAEGGGDQDGAESSAHQIVNARLAGPADGLFSSMELTALFSGDKPLRSVYDDAQRAHRVFNENLETFGNSVSLQPGRHGAHEPKYTSYTHFWKAVLGVCFSK